MSNSQRRPEASPFQLRALGFFHAGCMSSFPPVLSTLHGQPCSSAVDLSHQCPGEKGMFSSLSHGAGLTLDPHFHTRSQDSLTAPCQRWTSRPCSDIPQPQGGCLAHDVKKGILLQRKGMKREYAQYPSQMDAISAEQGVQMGAFLCYSRWHVRTANT